MPGLPASGATVDRVLVSHLTTAAPARQPTIRLALRTARSSTAMIAVSRPRATVGPYNDRSAGPDHRKALGSTIRGSPHPGPIGVWDRLSHGPPRAPRSTSSPGNTERCWPARLPSANGFTLRGTGSATPWSRAGHPAGYPGCQPSGRVPPPLRSTCGPARIRAFVQRIPLAPGFEARAGAAPSRPPGHATQSRGAEVWEMDAGVVGRRTMTVDNPRGLPRGGRASDAGVQAMLLHGGPALGAGRGSATPRGESVAAWRGSIGRDRAVRFQPAQPILYRGGRLGSSEPWPPSARRDGRSAPTGVVPWAAGSTVRWRVAGRRNRPPASARRGGDRRQPMSRSHALDSSPACGSWMWTGGQFGALQGCAFIRPL